VCILYVYLSIYLSIWFIFALSGVGVQRCADDLGFSEYVCIYMCVCVCVRYTHLYLYLSIYLSILCISICAVSGVGLERRADDLGHICVGLCVCNIHISIYLSILCISVRSHLTTYFAVSGVGVQRIYMYICIYISIYLYIYIYIYIFLYLSILSISLSSVPPYFVLTLTFLSQVWGISDAPTTWGLCEHEYRPTAPENDYTVLILPEGGRVVLYSLDEGEAFHPPRG